MTRRFTWCTRRAPHALVWVAMLSWACGQNPDPPEPFYTEEREPCADRNPLRNAYFGDLHVHTRNSFDAYVWENRNDAATAYDFAKGMPIDLPPLDGMGQGTQTLQLTRPLDFAAVTDHAEYLGEVATCADPDSSGYNTELCQGFRMGHDNAVVQFGTELTAPTPERFTALCGADGSLCTNLGRSVWQRVIDAAEAAYDRTSACTFTSLIGYEWTSNTSGRNLHRNVIFRNANVPAQPTSYFEASRDYELWAALERDCDRDEGCQVLAIPHNSNLSNGGMFAPLYPGAPTEDDQRARAALRARNEPLLEIFQHKGGSECINGISGVLGEPDELCDFEQLRPIEDNDCGESVGFFGIINDGCVSRYDFWRGQLLSGLREFERLGVNPNRLGVIASTDTHNSTPGATEEANFKGHIGIFEATPEARLGDGFEQPSGTIGNPGGLAGVWAEENSRDGIFRALSAREAFATSGTRIAPRLFGSFEYDDGLCIDPQMLTLAYDRGVPMGQTLPNAPSGATPQFIVSALRDPHADAAPLQHIQVIKGWLDDQGEMRVRVFDVAGDRENGASVDEATCEPVGAGFDDLCEIWTDTEFKPGEHAFYYARVVENPTCRWSWRDCLSLPASERPPACSDPAIPRTIQEMAWTSPIWYEP